MKNTKFFIPVIIVFLLFVMLPIKLTQIAIQSNWIEREFGSRELIEFSVDIKENYDEKYPKLITYIYSNRSNSPLFGSNSTYVFKRSSFMGFTKISTELAEKRGSNYFYLTSSSKGKIVEEENEKTHQVSIFNMNEKQGSIRISTQSKEHAKWIVEHLSDELVWYEILKNKTE
jgi:hypothetical protein